MKKLILKLLEQIIYKFSEHTPPDVKFSERNLRVANAALAIHELSKLF